MEARLRDAEKLTIEALPTYSRASRPRRTGPKLDEPPEPRAVTRVMTLLIFAHEVRVCANHGGFSAVHSKVTEKLGAAAQGYVDEVLEHLRNGDVADLSIAYAYLQIAADIVQQTRDEKAAELIRRRAGNACGPGARPPGAVVIDA